MSTYRMVYGDAEQVVRETYQDVEVEREDGWTVLFRGTDAILRVRDEHVQSLEVVDGTPADAPRALVVADLMRPAVTSIERNAHVAAAAYVMRRAGDTAVVVIDDEVSRTPLAIITSTDIAQAVADGKDVTDARVSDLVSRQPVTVDPQTPVADAAELMVRSRIHHLPVVSADGLVGMVDISDVCRGLMGQTGAA